MTTHKQGVFDSRGDADEKEVAAEEEEDSSWSRFVFSPERWRSIAIYLPLVAAICAPLATLLDIPALTVSQSLVRAEIVATLVFAGWSGPT